VEKNTEQSQVAALEVAMRVFFDLITLQKESGELPKALLDKPSLIGQAMHKIIPGNNLYFLKAKDKEGPGTYFKIGIARNVARRMISIKAASPLGVDAVIYVPIGPVSLARKVEQKVLEATREYHCNGEWVYAKNDDDVIEIAKRVDFSVGEWFESDFEWFKYEFNLGCAKETTGHLNALWKKVIAHMELETLETYMGGLIHGGKNPLADLIGKD